MQAARRSQADKGHPTDDASSNGKAQGCNTWGTGGVESVEPGVAGMVCPESLANCPDTTDSSRRE